MSSPLVAPPVVKTQAIFCPNCGGTVELRGFGHALTVVCQQCLSILDTSTSVVSLLGQIQEAQRRDLKIQLGTRGKMGGVAWQVIGFQTRSTPDPDSWDEYLLFNPYKGFRYITEYQGHWNFVTPLNPMPQRLAIGGRPAVSFDGLTFKHFSGTEATTTFVLGEFPWRVKVGEKVVADDFVAPPLILSSETTQDEVTWSRGEYTPGEDIWKGFALPGKPPAKQGVYLNQPSPHGKGGAWGKFFLLLMLLVGLAIFFATFSRENVVFKNSYTFSTLDQKGDPAFVTPVFTVDGRTSGLELSVHASIANNWAYFDFALINDDTGIAYDFGREVSYYYGSDSDGAWSEGANTSTVYIPSVPPGHYYLRVEPEMDPAEGVRRARVATKVNTMNYDITLRHDVPNYSWFWIAVLLLLIPPVFLSVRSRSFEVKRWMQSDYPPVTRG
jgi:hypothetical protein